MRSTIKLHDERYREVKAQAAREGRTVAEIIEGALRARRQHATVGERIEPLAVHRGSAVA